MPQGQLVQRRIQRFGWIPDVPDHRDLLYSAPIEFLRKVPAKVDLRGKCPPVYDQGQLGSCTANAIGAALEFDQMKQKFKAFTPSRLFIYYGERVIEGTVGTDSGAQIRDGIKVVSKTGACPEDPDWPYDIKRFADKPPTKAYADAKKFHAVQYSRVPQTTAQLKGCLASGYPFVFGFSVYESFESDEVARTGIVPMPKPHEQQLGGHAVMAVGYDDATNCFIVRNSWGKKWGLKGYFMFPYAYMVDSSLCDDFWTIRMVQQK